MSADAKRTRGHGNVVLGYEPGGGEHISVALETALTLANHNQCVVLCVHNDRLVRVRPGDSLTKLHDAWAGQQEQRF